MYLKIKINVTGTEELKRTLNLKCKNIVRIPNHKSTYKLLKNITWLLILVKILKNIHT